MVFNMEGLFWSTQALCSSLRTRPYFALLCAPLGARALSPALLFLTSPRSRIGLANPFQSPFVCIVLPPYVRMYSSRASCSSSSSSSLSLLPSTSMATSRAPVPAPLCSKRGGARGVAALPSPFLAPLLVDEPLVTTEGGMAPHTNCLVLLVPNVLGTAVDDEVGGTALSSGLNLAVAGVAGGVSVFDRLRGSAARTGNWLIRRSNELRLFRCIVLSALCPLEPECDDVSDVELAGRWTGGAELSWEWAVEALTPPSSGR